MKLNDFDKRNVAVKALAENYNVSFKADKLSLTEAKTMLKKVRSLAMEMKQSADFYKQQANPAYMKLVFMEQALVDQFNRLTSKKPRIVVENEEVEKSQVVLAAQDMVDSIQKMIEETSDMLVKELPALVGSVESEIGVNESQQFNTQATEALTKLTATLTESRTGMQNALNVITGQGAGFDMGAEAGMMPGAEAGMPGTEAGMMPGADAGMPGTEAGAMPDAGAEMPAGKTEEPEEMPAGGVGRAKR